MGELLVCVCMCDTARAVRWGTCTHVCVCVKQQEL